MEECWFYTAGGHECYKDFVQKFAADQAQGRNADLMALGRRSFSAREGGEPGRGALGRGRSPGLPPPRRLRPVKRRPSRTLPSPATGALDEPRRSPWTPPSPWTRRVALTTQPRLVGEPPAARYRQDGQGLRESGPVFR